MIFLTTYYVFRFFEDFRTFFYISSDIRLKIPCHMWCIKVQIEFKFNFGHGNISFLVHIFCLSLAATKQLYEWFSLSICPSVRPSVCLSVTPFWLCSPHRIITKFSGVITNDRSDVHANGQGHRSKVKVAEVITPLSRFRTVTPILIHIWWGNDALRLMLVRRGTLLFFNVIRQISRSHS